MNYQNCSTKINISASTLKPGAHTCPCKKCQIHRKKRVAIMLACGFEHEKLYWKLFVASGSRSVGAKWHKYENCIISGNFVKEDCKKCVKHCRGAPTAALRVLWPAQAAALQYAAWSAVCSAAACDISMILSIESLHIFQRWKPSH